MKRLFTSILLILAIEIAHAQVSTSPPTPMGPSVPPSEAQTFKERFEADNSSSMSSDVGSSGDINAAGWSGESSIDTSTSVDGSDSETHSVTSSDEEDDFNSEDHSTNSNDEGYTIDYEPASSNDSGNSDSGIDMIVADNSSAGSNVDETSHGMRTQPLLIFSSMASVFMTTVLVV
ncbi:hypothetical protein F443_14630 [Phytophthora nicotianae P1569]|uniref:RxLR effector protein n=1 Tax=Phytophthora nicotianae P1569 TaxID=1317065 RepID=V9EKP3_PHYNI|nr:hypothetical protein F443_14630 [Phytophthora nicotianae P1569]